MLVTKDGTVKLADFGLWLACEKEHDIVIADLAGTPIYFAQELAITAVLLHDQGINKPLVGFSTDSDIWAVGVFMWILAFKAYPQFVIFHEEKGNLLVWETLNALKGLHDPIVPPKEGDGLINMLGRIFVKVTQEGEQDGFWKHVRPTAKELLVDVARPGLFGLPRRGDPDRSPRVNSEPTSCGVKPLELGFSCTT